MEKMTEFKLEEKDGSIVDWVKIDRGNDEFTWMPKSIYDEMKAETPMVIDGD